MVVGRLGYTPEDFGRLRYCELALLLRGYRRRVRDEYEAKRAHNAWMASVMAHLQGAKVTPAEFLGKKEKPAKVSDEQNEKNLARLGMLPVTKQDGAEGAAWLLGGINGG